MKLSLPISLAAIAVAGAIVPSHATPRWPMLDLLAFIPGLSLSQDEAIMPVAVSVFWSRERNSTFSSTYEGGGLPSLYSGGGAGARSRHA